MSALVLVTTELSPFSSGGIGRVIHNMLATMSAPDRQRTIVLMLDAKIDAAAFDALFPGARLVLVDTNDESGRHGDFVHQPPRFAYTSTDWHWKSAVVLRALNKIAAHEQIDYVEFPDWGGLGFATVQEKRISGFLENARLAVRLHSTHGVLLQNEACALTPHDLNLADIERKTLRDCDLIVGQLAAVAEATRVLLGFTEAEWTPRLTLHAPPVLLDTRPPATQALMPGLSTPIMFGSKLQQFKRPDLFVRGVNIFCSKRPDYTGRIIFSAHSFDQDFRDIILRLIPPALAPRYSLDAPRESVAREPLVAGSVFVAPSDFESFCLSAYEAALLGAIVVVNAANPAFGEGTPWRNGENCIKFDGSVLGLAQALERVFALSGPLAMVEPPNDPWPWTAAPTVKNSAASALDANTPLVSVIVPHYNLASYLPATLSNLLEQTYSNYEIIVVDDGSTQAESRELIARLGEIHRNHLKILPAPGNLGLAGARNFGVAAARGDYILPIDADDLLDRRFIAIAVAALERNPEFDILVTQAAYFGQETEIPLPGEERDFGDYALFIGEALISGVKANRFSTATAFFRASVLREERYCEKLRCYEDWNLYLRLALAGKRFLVTNDVYFHYRNRPNSMVKEAHDPAMHGKFLHDMLRNAVDVRKLPPLAYLAFPSPPSPPPPPPPETIFVDAWPFALSRPEFKLLFVNAARRQMRIYQWKRLLFYPIAGLRRRYRARMRKWQGVLQEIRALNDV
jgi:glycosyltransferase involved in cell wall biosynthesis